MPQKKQEHQLLDWQLDEIRQAFNLFDADATGHISYYELRSAMRALGYNPKKAELRALIEDADPEQTGFVVFDGFLKLMTRHARTVDLRAEVDAIFALIAGSAQRDTISLANLRDAAREVGEGMSEDELREMVELLSNSKADCITKDEFASIMLPRQVDDSLNLDALDD